MLRLTILAGVALLAWAGSLGTKDAASAKGYHTQAELDWFRGGPGYWLPEHDNGYFMTSGHCDGCHGLDPGGQANVDANGHDVSPAEGWRATMMANSARDPFWRAKVSHEVLVNPAHQPALEDKCTSCHAPMGRFANHFFGLGQYGIEQLRTDSVALDGVSCLSCHKLSATAIGTTHSGNLIYDDIPVAYGPFDKPFSPPMQEFVGLIPVYSEHINHAGICGGCHTLLTHSADLQGNPTGQTFVEQATYHEWLNSDYADPQMGITCQGCHMPRINDEVHLAAQHLFLPPRSPFAKHELVGGNTFMLKLMKSHRQALGIPANETHFDTVIARTERMLAQQTLELAIEHLGTDADSAYFRVKLTNKAGHKFPSGYPSRRAFVEFIVYRPDGQVLFSSGGMDSAFEVEGYSDPFEPHHDIIRHAGQAQVYELVAGDVQGNVTTVLERAHQTLKDNRLVPKGFTTDHAAYDTTRIHGHALTDPDFNFDGFEGTGTDAIRYHVALNGFTGPVKVRARVRYQAVPPRWTAEMFAYSSPEIDTFRVMFNNADHTPFTVAADSLMGLHLVPGTGHVPQPSLFRAMPNPSEDGAVRLSYPTGWRAASIEVHSLGGVLVQRIAGSPSSISLPQQPGVYLIRAVGSDRALTLRVVRR